MKCGIYSCTIIIDYLASRLPFALPPSCKYIAISSLRVQNSANTIFGAKSVAYEYLYIHNFIARL